MEYLKLMVHIRPAQPQDIATVYSLGEQVAEFKTSNQAPLFWPPTVLQDCITSNDVYFFVAQQDTEVVGFIIANLNRSLQKALIENIFVRQDMRGQGVGLALTQKVVQSAQRDGFTFITVLTPPDDIAAIKTYQKAGFMNGEVFLWLDFTSVD